jgi:hypothetical protein
MLNIITVLKKSKDFDEEYVYPLIRQLDRHLHLPYSFWCYASEDVNFSPEYKKRIRVLPFMRSYPEPYYWYKIELFGRFLGPSLFLDLDTVVTGSLEPLAKAIYSLGPEEFMMLRAFNDFRKWASGVMGWNSPCPFLFNAYDATVPKAFHLEQDFLFVQLSSVRGWGLRAVDEFVGVKSYKNHVRSSRDISGASLICFHGKPRPKECLAEPWVAEAWKEEVCGTPAM